MSLKKIILTSALIFGSIPASAEAKGPLTCTVQGDSLSCARTLDDLQVTYTSVKENDKKLCTLTGTNQDFSFELVDNDCDRKVDVYRGNLIGNKYAEIYRERSEKNRVSFERKFDTLYNQIRQETLTEFLSKE